MKKLLACLSIVSIVLAACSKANESALSGDNPNVCDTVNMKYTANILPIIQNNCYACHGNGLSQNGVSLDSYEKLKVQAANGTLIGVITHAPGFNPMPEGGAKLSDCNINKIKDWIAHNMPQ
jgi:cytochrome c5